MTRKPATPQYAYQGDPNASWLRNRVRRHIGELARIAPFVIVSRAGILLLLTADFIMLGQSDARETGYYSLASAPFIFLMVTGIGTVQGVMIVTSHRFGAGDLTGCGAVWRRGLLWAFLMGSLLTILSMQSGTFFHLIGQEASLADGAGEAAFWMSLGLMPNMLFATCSFWLEAIKRPKPGLAAIIAANIVNIALNSVLIEDSGADGAALATSLARVFMAAALILYIWNLRDRDAFGLREPADPGRGLFLARWWRGSREQRKYGYATGVAYGFESASFSVMQLYAGWLGYQAAAAYGIGMNLTALLFMSALGMAAATSVRVGIAHGRSDYPDRALAGWVGLGATTVMMGIVCLVLTTSTDWVVSLYTDAPDLIPLLLPAVFLVGFIMLGDGLQIVLSNVIRASAEPWIATFLNFVSYACVQIPLGYILAITLQRGVQGLFEAILIAAIVSASLLGSRWTLLCWKASRGTS